MDRGRPVPRGAAASPANEPIREDDLELMRICRDARNFGQNPIFAETSIFIKFAPVLQVKRFVIIFFAKFGQSARIGAFQPSEHEHYIDLLA